MAQLLDNKHTTCCLHLVPAWYQSCLDSISGYIRIHRLEAFGPLSEQHLATSQAAVKAAIMGNAPWVGMGATLCTAESKSLLLGYQAMPSIQSLLPV